MGVGLGEGAWLGDGGRDGNGVGTAHLLLLWGQGL